MKPDYLAPIINGFDCAGIINRNSFSCEPFEAEGDNGGMLLDGSTIKDILAVKRRLSWTLNTTNAARYAAFTAALDGGDALNLVNAIAFDPLKNRYCVGDFYVTRPAFQLSLIVDGVIRSRAGPSLILEQQGALSWFIVTPPDTLSYEVGDAFDSSGFRVALSDDNGAVTDITPECSLISGGASLSDGDLLTESGNFPVSVTYHNAHIGAFTLNVYPIRIIYSGTYSQYGADNHVHVEVWSDGLLTLSGKGQMANYTNPSFAPYAEKINRIIVQDGVSGGFTMPCEVLAPNVSSVAIPDSIDYIYRGTFLACEKLREIQLPDNISFGYNAFQGCTALTDFVMPSGSWLSTGLFAYCSALANVTLPDELPTPGEHAILSVPPSAFLDCSALKSVKLPKGINWIERMAFYRCSALTSVTIPDSVIHIENLAFYGTQITSVTISRDCVVGEKAFPDNCVISYYEEATP